MRRIFSLLAPSLLALPGCYVGEDTGLIEFSEHEIAGEYVVGISDEASEADLQSLAEREGLDLVEMRNSDRLAVLVDPQGRERDALLGTLDEDLATTWAEPQFIYRPSSMPNDYGEYMWGLNNTGMNGGTAGADIDAFGAWDITRGSGVVVAVIDTGVDVTHPDLVPNLWVNQGEIAGNGIDDDGNGYVDDVNGYDFVNRDADPNDRDGHGTHVAGSVAARGDDGYGVPGVAYEAQIMSLKFLDGWNGGLSSQAAEAITYAVNNGADVINASWGGPGYSSAIRNAIAYARSRGVVFVAAAGNEGRNNDSTGSYPANYNLDNVIAVAATDRRDRLASFSNYGASRVHVAAPGVDIVSTVPGPNWEYQDGTSMASPYVAGAAALLRAAVPNLTPAGVRQALMDSAVDVPALSGLVASGRIDAFAALDRVGAVVDPGQEEPEEPEEPEQPPPAEWTFEPFSVASPHPYSNNFSGQVQIQAPAGATELRVHFTRIDVEANYDFVVVRDAAGTKLAEWTGDLGAVVSEALPHAAVTVHLFTDGSVTEWGLQIEGYSWR
ncbi:MAG: S8 family serine peptidase [Deltaproteobacteria bacterium]|nr:S8 family serine peptidase [Deltaproteobacteria bacterium]